MNEPEEALDQGRVILEVGCGDKPQPPRSLHPGDFFVACDIASVVERASAEHCRMRSDARKLALRSATVDCVLARNVFGDAGLGFTPQQLTGCTNGEEYAALVKGLLERREWARLEALRTRMRQAAEHVWNMKLDMLREVARVLRPQGSLILVESLTPQFAVEFMKRLASSYGARMESLTWTPVAGYRRRRKYCNDEELANANLQVWAFARCV